ncbi:MAG: tRNA (uridine(34)/cytosine(34)/5-carboxymethylaminomethyluridine(34)-2'-O)-methyltransferase TrmL [Halanaerobiales bacterium]|nr:tRNA (uridine(34)/cytosine(34)/5-carboxymethylaminomethyluridine(34)-2'-O)-methyltransferase TrmL [Halanaerobiales bacterium]
MNIVLVEPEIPQNTGNIARTCAATDSSLHLVHPLGFSTEDKYLKRAGLDYWHLLDINYYDNFESFLEKKKDERMFFASTKSPHRYDQVDYKKGDYLVFGKETAGLPEKFLKERLDYTIRIPMIEEARSLNLANSVSIVLYEAYRQLDFPNFNQEAKFSNSV